MSKAQAGSEKKSVTLATRATPRQAEEVEVAAGAAHLTISAYLYRRITGRPILSTPRLAALAQLMRTLKRVEASDEPASELVQALEAAVAQLSLMPAEPGEPI
jgi:hypothetical protein